MPVPTAGVYRLGAIVAIEAAPMGDDTRELLNAHKDAILRELDGLGRDVRSDFASLREDLAGTRRRQDEHNSEDNRRFGNIDNSLSVLKWAYGIGIVIIGALLMKMGWIQ